MNSQMAKDFLVEQVARQAALEHVVLSDLEKRMMYFTESGQTSEDPIELNAAFERECDSAEYETKMAGLLQRAYARLKRENLSPARTWDEAVRELRKGDHYLLVLLDYATSRWKPFESAASPTIFSGSFWKVLGIALLLLILGMVIFVYLLHRADSMPAPQRGRSISRSRELLVHHQRVDKSLLRVLKRTG
jgi:hypothetical protein